MALVAELERFGRPDLVVLADGRWEVLLRDDVRSPISEILCVVQTWLGVWRTAETTVHIAGRPRIMSAPETP